MSNHSDIQSPLFSVSSVGRNRISGTDKNNRQSELDDTNFSTPPGFTSVNPKRVFSNQTERLTIDANSGNFFDGRMSLNISVERVMKIVCCVIFIILALFIGFLFVEVQRPNW